ncbi:unnamed protein product [Ambrosiozyma monospora]|uniref:Unnamed protein product n=1 Tax=Ambrosiozyma monospora TaxID=43982 RepID=A0ACB5TT79_AMBMO|nr:unnamed protein product [Ambrosiozyma monospora]
MLPSYIQIVSSLPIELQQQVIRFSLQEINNNIEEYDNNYNRSKRLINRQHRRVSPPPPDLHSVSIENEATKNYFDSVWCHLIDVINYVSRKPKTTISILVNSTLVELQLDQRIKLQIMNNMNTKNPASWIKFISHIPLASLQVRSRSLGGRYGEKHKVQKLQLISFLLKQYKPIEFGIYEPTADFSHLLQYDYNWIGL